MTTSARLDALNALANDIESRRGELETALVTLKHVLRSVARGDIDLAVARLRAFSSIAPLVDGREPVGCVGVVLPGNALLSNPVNAIGTAFLGGNGVRARFPAGSRAWGGVVETLLRRNLWNVAIEELPGRQFIERVAVDTDFRAMLVFGEDRWASGYEDLMRRTGTKFVFEGGGNCPFVVLEDADIELAAEQAARGAFFNSGQACTSPERAYVHSSAYDRFRGRVTELASANVVGEPDEAGSTIGPLVSRAAASRIADQLQQACDLGATACTGGAVVPGRLRDGAEAWWVEPTVLTDVSPEAEVQREETFGPVLTVSSVRDDETALAAAASSDYGLAASVFGGGSREVLKLRRSHGRVFQDEIWLDHDRRELHGPLGGRKRSGWVWAWEGDRFVQRDGPHRTVIELTAPARAGSRPQEEVMVDA